MDAAYLRAAHPKPFTIFGKTLEPFSLGHEILFQRFRNKFSVESTEPPGFDDLFTGVHICAGKYDSKISLDNFSIPMRVRIVAKVLGVAYIGQAFELFSEYIKAHTEIPEFYIKGDESHDPVGSPTVQIVKVSLMSNLGVSEEDALNKCFSLAFWDHLRWQESQGYIQIIDEAEKKRLSDELELAKKMGSKLDALAESLRAEGFFETGVVAC
jgi:hypothetical protein